MLSHSCGTCDAQKIMVSIRLHKPDIQEFRSQQIALILSVCICSPFFLSRSVIDAILNLGWGAYYQPSEKPNVHIAPWTPGESAESTVPCSDKLFIQFTAARDIREREPLTIPLTVDTSSGLRYSDTINLPACVKSTCSLQRFIRRQVKVYKRRFLPYTILYCRRLTPFYTLNRTTASEFLQANFLHQHQAYSISQL
jgi:hypothetical protein